MPEWTRFAALVILIFLSGFAAQSQVVQFGDSTTKGSLFPLMHGLVARAKAQGAQFPKPFGLAGSIYWQRMPMEIERVSLGGLVLEEKGSLLNVAGSTIENTTLTTQGRADLWLLPFLNVYGMAGKVTTFNDIKLRVNINAPPLPGIVPGDIQTLERGQIANVTGTVMAFGAVLAGGYKKLFANVNLTWARTHLNQLNSNQKAFVAVPMLGYTTSFANLFMGAMYQNTGQQNKGSFISQSGSTVDYQLDFRARRWNLQVGLNKTIGSWQFNMIQGLGTRTNGTIELGYRFGN